MWKLLATTAATAVAVASVGKVKALIPTEKKFFPLKKKREAQNAHNHQSKVYQFPQENLDWWQDTVIYQVYPRSFLDTNEDGIGDLKGIQHRLEYFKYLGVKTIWLNPVYKSPMKDFGYDISDFRDIDPVFGCMEDFDELLNCAKNMGIKVVLDLVPNHTSKEHCWFKKSRRKEDPFTDYYIWADGKGPDKKDPPNNWLSVYGGPAWTFDPQRCQFYFHQFLKDQPDLNYRNHLVKKEMERIMRFWLDKGVDGFRVDSMKHIFEDCKLTDEPASNNPCAKPCEYDFLTHCYTTDQPEGFQLLHEWRQLLNSYECRDGHHRLLMVEVYDPVDIIMKYYGTCKQRLADFPFNFELIKLNRTTTARQVHELITGWLDAMPPNMWPNWVVGNHDQPRVASRTSPCLVDCINMIALLLPGTAVTYYGEEIGMEEIEVCFEETQDPAGIKAGKDRYHLFSRDPQRSPMQWNACENAGFTNVDKPWLPVHPYYEDVNVQVEAEAQRSHLHVYKKLVELRSEPAMQCGSLQFPLVTDCIFSFVRSVEDTGYLVLMNWSSERQCVDMTQSKPCGFTFPCEGTICVASTNIPDDSPLVCSDTVSLKKIALGPYQAIVVKFPIEKECN